MQQQLKHDTSKGKLEKLNDVQLAKMQEIRDKWLNRLFSCKNTEINREQAIAGINWIYKLSKLKEPMIIFVDSPVACQYAYHLLKQHLSPQFQKKLDQVGDQVGVQVGAQVRTQVWVQVSDQVWEQVREQVGTQVSAQVKQEKLEFQQFSSYGNIWDYGWLAFYEFFMELGIGKHEEFEQFKSLLLSNVYDMIQLEGVCIVSALPIIIHRNEANNMHFSEGPAIEFKDGYFQHYINGVFVTCELFDSLLNKQYKLENFIAEKNEEIKAACLFFMREKWGEDYVIAFFADHLKEIDTYVDKKQEHYLKGTNGGMNIGVYTLFKGNINNIQLSYVRCYCPSSDRMFYLGVDPKQTNAKDAIASLYRVPACLKSHIKEIRRQGKMFAPLFGNKY